MTGIPVHTVANQGSRSGDDGWLAWPIAEWNTPREAGQAWARLTGREGEGATTGGEQPSLQQEEEGGKEKERARERDQNKGVISVRELVRC